MIPEEKYRIFNYIRDEIASGRREAADVAILREARKAHFRQLHLIPKEDEPSE